MRPSFRSVKNNRTTNDDCIPVNNRYKFDTTVSNRVYMPSAACTTWRLHGLNIPTLRTFEHPRQIHCTYRNIQVRISTTNDFVPPLQIRALEHSSTASANTLGYSQMSLVQMASEPVLLRTFEHPAQVHCTFFWPAFTIPGRSCS